MYKVLIMLMREYSAAAVDGLYIQLQQSNHKGPTVLLVSFSFSCFVEEVVLAVRVKGAVL